jgi:trans-feruloyl-CoA hydratase/vanillin synthase
VPNYECIKVESDDRVTTVTLNRPDKRNAMSPTLNDEMLDAMTKIGADRDTDVLVLTGSGESFSAGMDLQEYFRDTDNDPLLQEHVRWVMREWSYTKLRFLPCVTIAAVNGWCFGGAFMPLVSCDLAIAADEATFGLSEVNWGIIPGGLVTRDIAVSLSYRDALYYALTGESFGGQRAREIGLVNESVPRAELDGAVKELIGKIRRLNPQTLRSIKETYRHAATMNYEQAADYMGAKAAQLLLRDTEGGREKGLSQFLDSKEIRPGLQAYIREPLQPSV